VLSELVGCIDYAERQRLGLFYHEIHLAATDLMNGILFTAQGTFTEKQRYAVVKLQRGVLIELTGNVVLPYLITIPSYIYNDQLILFLPQVKWAQNPFFRPPECSS
jgi:hypothetical protein